MPAARDPHLLHSDFALPERMAMALDGEAYAVDDAHAHLDEPETPSLRAAALSRQGLHPRLIAERWTAAWLWLALPRPPRTHTFCVSIRSRVQHHRPPNRVIREVIIADDEITEIDGIRVTTIERTALDLARIEPPAASGLRPDEHDQRIVQALHALLERSGLLPGVLVARLPRSTTQAMRLCATARLVAAAQLEVTR